jgi:hypothetical protein
MLSYKEMELASRPVLRLRVSPTSVFSNDQPGQSGSPGGKPKIDRRISAEYSALLLDIASPAGHVRPATPTAFAPMNSVLFSHGFGL